MKIDMMESLGYSFLRHVQGCWIAQTNWKASIKGLPEEIWPPLEAQFEDMQKHFGPEVFMGTTTARQLLKQAEIDVVAMTAVPPVHVHALDAAFHESGLSYGKNGKDVTIPTIRKKMLRTHLVLEAFAGFAKHHHIWFVSAKVQPKHRDGLNAVFAELRSEYPHVNWELRIDESFHDDVLRPTLDESTSVSDTSELLVRADRLLRAVAKR